VTYVPGPGSTVGAIKEALGFEGSPLGVDVWRDGEVLVRDGGEREILDALGEENVVVVSPIGGQGSSSAGEPAALTGRSPTV